MGDRVDGGVTARDPAEVLGTIAGFLREILGEDWAADVSIGPDTSLNADLELESIELVALAEKLQARYGAEVDFVGWLSGMDLDRILGLTVGDLVEFIVGAPASGSA